MLEHEPKNTKEMPIGVGLKTKNNSGLHIPIIGNGDVTTPELAAKLFTETGVDAVMIGRGAIATHGFSNRHVNI